MRTRQTRKPYRQPLTALLAGGVLAVGGLVGVLGVVSAAPASAGAAGFSNDTITVIPGSVPGTGLVRYEAYDVSSTDDPSVNFGQDKTVTVNIGASSTALRTGSWTVTKVRTGQLSSPDKTEYFTETTRSADFTYNCMAAGTVVTATASATQYGVPSGSPTVVPDNGPLPASCTTSVVPTLALSVHEGQAGAAFTVKGSGYVPREVLTITFNSSPVTLGTVAVDATGSFSFPTAVPAGATVGAHEVGITASSTGEQRLPFTVLASQPTPTTTPNPTPSTTPDHQIAPPSSTTTPAGAGAGSPADGNGASGSNGRGLNLQTAASAGPDTAMVLALAGLGLAGIALLGFGGFGLLRRARGH